MCAVIWYVSWRAVLAVVASSDARRGGGYLCVLRQAKIQQYFTKIKGATESGACVLCLCLFWCRWWW